jgi:hypothetical protein
MLVETSLVLLQRHPGTPSCRVSLVAPPLSLAVLSIKKSPPPFHRFRLLLYVQRSEIVELMALIY